MSISPFRGCVFEGECQCCLKQFSHLDGGFTISFWSPEAIRSASNVFVFCGNEKCRQMILDSLGPAFVTFKFCLPIMEMSPENKMIPVPRRTEEQFLIGLRASPSFKNFLFWTRDGEYNTMTFISTYIPEDFDLRVKVLVPPGMTKTYPWMTECLPVAKGQIVLQEMTLEDLDRLSKPIMTFAPKTPVLNASM